MAEPEQDQLGSTEKFEVKGIPEKKPEPIEPISVEEKMLGELRLIKEQLKIEVFVLQQILKAVKEK